MNEHIKAIKAIIAEVREASEEKDWERLKTLDEIVREPVEQAVSAAKAGEVDTVAVEEVLDQLLAAFEDARAVAVEARDEAASLLKQSGKTHQAAKAYLDQSKPTKG